MPKTGGNKLEGAAYFSGTGEHLQSDNFTPDLQARGLAAATPISKVYDLNGKQVLKQGPVAKNASFELGMTDKDYFVLVTPS